MSQTTEAAAPEIRVLRDAAETRRAPTIDDARASGVRRKQIAQLQRALKLADSEPKKALAVAQKALELDGEFSKAQHIVGLLLDRGGQISTALGHYEHAWRLDPEDAEIYQNLGLAAWKLDMLEAAERFFRISRQKEPGRIDGTVNLAGVLRDQSRFEDAIELLRQAIFADERNATLWNTLGTVLLESGDPAQAETFYREALALQPDFARAWHNLAYALDMLGDVPGSLDAYERALSHPTPPSDTAIMRHGQSFSLLSAGRIAEGWDAYEVRMSPHYAQSTVFVIGAPRWDRADGDAVRGKRVLLVGEQGLGDEILFANAARDLEDAVGPDGHLLIACERRLVSMFARAFPRATVGAHATFAAEARKFRTIPWLENAGGADLWTPMGDPVCAFRRTLDSFPDTFPEGRGFLPADPARMTEMREKLAALGTGLNVGVVWKSMLMNASRAKYFSAFAQWAPVLKTPGVNFVNLQYGEVAAELAQAERELGVTIHRIPGLDVKDDLEGVAALGACLDLSIGPMTASINLAAAAGGEVWVLGYRNQWTSLGTDRLPFYPGARMVCPPGWNRWADAMREAAAALAERAGAAQVAAA